MAVSVIVAPPPSVVVQVGAVGFGPPVVLVSEVDVPEPSAYSPMLDFSNGLNSMYVPLL